MSTTENTVKSRAAKTGPFATLSTSLRVAGTSAPSSTFSMSPAEQAHLPSRPRRTRELGREISGDHERGRAGAEHVGIYVGPRRRGVAALALTLAALALLASVPSSAFAAKTVVQTLGNASTGTTGALFNGPRGIAVNTTGSGGVAKGTFYVVDGANRRIQRFAPDGSFLAAWGWDVNSPDGDAAYEICTVAANCLQDTPAGNNAGQLNNPQGIAIDQANGNVYVSDAGSRRINAFSATGFFYGAFGWGAIDSSAAFQFCTTFCGAPGTAAPASGNVPGGQFGGSVAAPGLGGLAVDSTGKIYLANRTSRRVDVFTPTLLGAQKAVTAVAFTRSFGWGIATGAAAFEVCNAPAVCKAPAAAGVQAGNFATGSPLDIVLDASGNLYALDAGNKRLQKFNTTPAPVTAPTFDASGAIASTFGGSLYGIAYDAATDHLYLAGSIGRATIADTGPSAGTLTVRAAGGNYKLTFAAQTTANIAFGATAAAVQSALEALSNIAPGDVTVTGGPGDQNGTTPYTVTFTGTLAGHAVSEITSDTAPLTTGTVRVAEMDATGAALDIHGQDLTIATAGTPTTLSPSLAVAPSAAGGNIFLASANGGSRVFLLNNPPAATLDDITVKTTTTATFSGTVDPTGGTVSCKFQYSTDQSNWTDVSEPGCASLAPGGGPQAVSESITGLQPNKLYYVRLIATKAGGAGVATTATKSFTTDAAPPTVSDTAVSSIATASATLNAKVNPQNQTTTWHFEYGDQGPCSLNPCASTPELSVGTGADATLVSREITGLAPATTYHFRIVATNPSSPLGGTAGPDLSFTTYAPSPVFDPCDNDALRSGLSAKLPDCRAYEQASPVDKNGQDVLGKTDRMAASSNGDAVLYYSLNGQPNGVSSSLPFYLARRGAGQWSARGVKAPPSYGLSSVTTGWLPDLSTIFLNAGSLLARESDGGALTALSTAGSGIFAGASADGSIVYFSGSGANVLAPGAIPNKPNLYAWDRGTNTMTLAGVLPDSACAPALPPCLPAGSGISVGATGADPFDLGTALNYPVESHAVSASGDAYFSDADDGQLYLRRDPFGSPSTLHVSASQRTDCADDPSCGGDDVPDPVADPFAPPATFQAATPDGSHAFFASSEELTDDANTHLPFDFDPPGIARADLPVNPGDPVTGIDKKHLPLPIESLPPPGALAADADHLYWVEPDNDSIARGDLDGSNVEHDFIVGADNPKDVAVDDNHIYWTNNADGGATSGSIGRADLPANPADPATNVDQSCLAGLNNPHSIAVDSSHVYWTIPGTGLNGDVGRADLACNQASVEPLFIDTFIRGDIAVNANYLYGTLLNGAAAFIYRFNVADGSFVDTAVEFSNATTAPALALDGSHLYWTAATTSGGSIGRSDLDGTNASEEHSFVPGLTAPIGLAPGQGADAGHLYWVTGAPPDVPRGKDLYRYDAGSGDLTDLTPYDGTELGADVRAVLGASDDGDYVYFVANADLDGSGGDAEAGNCAGSVGGLNLGDLSGQCSIYLAHGGDTTFVARLDTDGDAAGQSDAANWVSINSAVPAEKTARVSAGGVLLFRSQRSLTGYDNDGTLCESQPGHIGLQPGRCPELYRYDADADELSCVSCNPTGAAPSGPARIAQFNNTFPALGVDGSALTRNLSADGNRVFFETPDKLIAADVNGDGGCPGVIVGTNSETFPTCLDVYMWEAEGSGSCHSAAQNGGCLYLISSGTGTDPAFFLGASTSGDDAFFFTREQLVPQDADGLRDVYDARVGGGLSAQHEPPPAPCDLGAGACEGASSSAPNDRGAGTAAFQGPGNQQAQGKANKRRCPKGKRKVRRKGKVRCVKRHRRHSHKRANHNRRAGR